MIQASEGPDMKVKREEKSLLVYAPKTLARSKKIGFGSEFALWQVRPF